jgi:demethylmenaquinone methyltransferase/2-methoxy-6-polyprenyl-1,4-benzoquinol methylase
MTRSDTSSSDVVWSATDLAGDPHEVADKAERVQRMFSAIAASYDLNNRLHSFGRDQAWRRKAVRLCRVRPTDRVLDPLPEYVHGDAMDLPFEDAAFDVVSIAFGIRNVTDPARALREFRRVLRPDGRLIILEFDAPENRLLRRLNHLYTARIMPVTATWLSRDRSGAYRYLPRSVGTFNDRTSMLAAMTGVGFDPVVAHPMTFGVCVGYLGVVRSPEAP